MLISDITETVIILKGFEDCVENKKDIPYINITYMSSIEIHVSFDKKNNSFVKSAPIVIYLLGGNPSIFNRTPTIIM